MITEDVKLGTIEIPMRAIPLSQCMVKKITQVLAILSS